MDNILDRIVIDIREKVEKDKVSQPLEQIFENPLYSRTPLSFRESICRPGASGVIAEFKRRSPSKGIINGEADIHEVVEGYEAAGASAVSVLTNHTFFGGCEEYLRTARSVLNIPVLRKEFIVDPYQIHEAKVLGADFILLIAEILSRETVSEFTALAHSLGMEVLMELHSDEEVEKIIPELDAVGINNRNLKTFEVDIERSIALASSLPNDMIKVAESGLSNPATAIKMRDSGFKGFLIGEQFMKMDDPAAACADFCRALKA